MTGWWAASAGVRDAAALGGAAGRSKRTAVTEDRVGQNPAGVTDAEAYAMLRTAFGIFEGGMNGNYTPST